MNYFLQIQTALGAHSKPWDSLFNAVMPKERLSPIYLASALVISLIIYIKDQGLKSFSAVGFMKFCFPAKIYFNRSAGLDFIYYIIYQMLAWCLLAPILLNPNTAASFFSALLNRSFPAPEGLYVSSGLLTGIFTLSNILAVDFSNFITHYYQHKISWLWEFHKVHHSAAVLTPVTVYRVHPVDNLVTLSVAGVLTGMNYAFFNCFFPGRFSEIRVLNLNLFVFLFYFLGFNLRHSHVWFNYPGFLSRVFISPAQHQIHHSKSEEHQDKNFGFLFAFWDLWVGSLVIPCEKIEVQFGLFHDEEAEYLSVSRLFFLPFIKIGRRLNQLKWLR